MSQAKIFEENILGGETKNSLDSKNKKHYKRKRKKDQRGCGERIREKEKKEKKTKLSKLFYGVPTTMSDQSRTKAELL